MGQEQSNPLIAKNAPSLTPSPSTNRPSLLNIAYQQNNTESEIEDSSAIEENDQEVESESESELEQGIIEVVKGPENAEEDEELQLLKSIKTFKPFIKEQDKGFSIENLLGLKSNTSKPKVLSQNSQALSEPLFDIFFGLQTHIKEQMSHINLEQRILLKRITYVDELSTASSQTMTAAFTQAKLAADKVSEAIVIKEQAAKAHDYAVDIFKTLTKLEQYLDPEDRILATNDINTKWPVLNELRITASKSTDTPLLERYISSASEITTVGTSTTPLIEKAILTAEPLNTDIHKDNDDNNGNDPSKTAGSTSTSSLALSKLRGLSSKSNAKVSPSSTTTTNDIPGTATSTTTTAATTTLANNNTNL